MKRVILFLLFTGCATTTNLPDVDPILAEQEAHKQRVLAWARFELQQKRLSDVAFRIISANAELCGDDTEYSLGLRTATLEHFDDEWRSIAEREANVGKRVTIVSVSKGSPAFIMGLNAGDRIINVNGKALGEGKGAVARLQKYLKENSTLTLERNQKQFRIEIQPVRVCSFPILLLRSDSVNAWTDGSSIFFTTAMLRFTPDDHGLALIVGHEMAHITKSHVPRQATNIIVGAALGALIGEIFDVEEVDEKAAEIGAQAFSQDFESEADYVGAYYAARAGYDVMQGVNIWREFAASYPAAIDLEGSTHPSTARRFLAVEQTHAEIERKREEGKALAPNKKD